jgi:pimeloyl-ACP methyl ester carboxylesterase
MLGATRVTAVGDTTIAWTELGEGEPLVLLHGLGDSHRTWRHAARRLARSCRVIMPDLPGHGLSGRPDAPYTLNWYANTMLSWMSKLDIPHAHLCGHSFGGGVAQWMLLAAHERVDTLALVAAGGLGPEVALGVRIAAFPILGRLLTQPLMGVGTWVMMKHGGGPVLQSESWEVARSVWMNRAPGTGRAFRRTVVGCMNLQGQHQQTWTHIHKVPRLPPTLVFWGDNDSILPVKHCLDARLRIQGARIIIYSGCGHFLQLERAEQFAFELADFIKYPPPSPVLLG